MKRKNDNDKRNTVIDALQEAGDLLQYIWKAKLNSENLDQVKYVVKIIQDILKD